MTEERSSLIPRRNHSYGSTAPNDISNENGISHNNNFASTSIASQSLPTDTPTTPTDQTRSTLSALDKLGFGFGHIYNDLCAGVWFSYTLLFMQGALLLPGPEAGALMMLGQVGDALATPVVGYLADKFGTKQKWHIFGKNINNRTKIGILRQWTHLLFYDFRNWVGLYIVSIDLFNMPMVYYNARMVASHLLQCSNISIPIWLGHCSGDAFGNDSRNVTQSKGSH